MSPLKTGWFHILLALAGQDRHGYAIMTDVLEQTGGRVKLWPAKLYGSLQEMKEQGLLQEVRPPASAPADRVRRRHYHLTAAGRNVLKHETQQMAHYVKTAQMRKIRTGQ